MRRVRALGVGAGLLAIAPGAAAAKPNLAITKLASPPRSATVFGSFTARDKVRVHGKAPKGIHVEYLLSQDGKRDAGDVPLLGLRLLGKLHHGVSSGKARLTIPGLLPAGDWRLIACVDPGATLKEKGERDNCKAAKRAVSVSKLARRGPLNATATLDRSRTKTLSVLRTTALGAGHGGTAAGSLTVVGADGTRYVLRVPAAAGVVFAQIAMTPISHLAGVPGAGRVLGVQLSPAGQRLLRGATLTVTPKPALSPSRAVAVTYDGSGRDLRLAALSGSPRSFTFPVQRLGGYALIEGRPRGGAPGVSAAATGGSTSLADVAAHTPAGALNQTEQDVSEAIGEQRQRDLLGAQDEFDHSALYELVRRHLEDAAFAQVRTVEQSPTLVNLLRALRELPWILRDYSMVGTEDDSYRQLLARIRPRLRAAYQKVLDRMHACNGGMADVLGLATLRAASFDQAFFDLPEDASTACTRLRFDVEGSESGYDSDLDTDYGVDVAVHFPARNPLDFTTVGAPGQYSNGKYNSRQGCWHTTGDVTPRTPWEFAGQTSDLDAYVQSGDASKIGFWVLVDAGDATQHLVIDDPDCDGAPGDVVHQVAGSFGDNVAMVLTPSHTFVATSDTDDTHIQYTVTAVP